MMMKNELVPERRFEGFTGEWEEKKLEDVAPLQRGFDLTRPNISKGPYPVIFSNGIGAWNSIYKIKGPGVITGRSGSIGNVSYIEQNYWPHNTSLWVTNFFENYPLYIYYLYQKVDLSKFGTGSGVPTLNRNDVHDYFVFVPSAKEQQKIGQFFKQLDEMIAIQQRKIDKTKALKSAYFVEMFPAEGESVPKRRFSGFTGEWEEYSLGELTKINTGGSDAQDAKENGAYPFFVRSEKIQRSDNYTFNGEAILIPGEGRLGEIYHHFIGKFDYHQRVYKISHFDEKLDGKFTFYTMHKTFKKHALKYTVKATVDSLRLPIITEYKLLLPTIKEQQKIGQFFKHLDEMIATHQQKLEKLKATKQAYLHEMFV